VTDDAEIPRDEWRVVDTETGETVTTRSEPAEAERVRARRNSERPPEKRTLELRQPLAEVPHERE